MATFKELVLRAIEELPTDRKGYTRQAILKFVETQVWV